MSVSLEISAAGLIAMPSEASGGGRDVSHPRRSQEIGAVIETFLVARGDRSNVLRSLTGSRYVVVEDADAYANLTRVGSRMPASLLLIASEALDDQGAAIARDFKGDSTEGKVVAIIDAMSPQLLANTFKSYVDGYLPASASSRAMISYLDLAMLGERFIAGECLSILKATVRLWGASADQTVAEVGDSDPTSGLSLQQIQVLMCLTDGLTDKEIADRLGIVEATVRFHNRACWPKIGAKNRTQAALWAVRNLNLG